MDQSTAQYLLFIVANLLIVAGYLAMPLLFLRYLPLTRTVQMFGVGLFLSSMGTHLGIAIAIFGAPYPPTRAMGWFWPVEFLFHAGCLWGFIVTFHRMLRAASMRRVGRVGRGGAPSTAGGPQ